MEIANDNTTTINLPLSLKLITSIIVCLFPKSNPCCIINFLLDSDYLIFMNPDLRGFFFWSEINNDWNNMKSWLINWDAIRFFFFYCFFFFCHQGLQNSMATSNQDGEEIPHCLKPCRAKNWWKSLHQHKEEFGVYWYISWRQTIDGNKSSDRICASSDILKTQSGWYRIEQLWTICLM